MVHDRRVEGETLTLRVSGKVVGGNLVMYDDKSRSLWLQKSGAALQGPLKGRYLKKLPASNVEAGIRWDEWRKGHPDSKVLHCEHCLPGLRKKSSGS